MSESMQLREPLYKLIIRFGNGEMINHIVSEPIDSRHIASDTRYAIISCFALQNPSECTDITVINLRDVTFIKTERVTLDQVGTERRMAGLHASSSSKEDDRMPKTMAQLRFI
jgi:hypothetical protein